MIIDFKQILPNARVAVLFQKEQIVTLSRMSFANKGGHNGHNNNPNYVQYCYTMNGIILGQSTTTKNISNTGKVKSVSFFTPGRLV